LLKHTSFQASINALFLAVQYPNFLSMPIIPS